MISSEDVKNKTFEKAVFGGYDMGGVDDFLDEIAQELDALHKENNILKGKLKVLANKVEEYRNNEDALRTAILSAQKLGIMIEKEAKDNSAKMIADAQAEADRITSQSRLQVELEEAKLQQAKKQSAAFIDNMDLLCRRQSEFIARISSSDYMKEIRESVSEPETAAPAVKPMVNSTMNPDSPEVHEAVKSIEDALLSADKDSKEATSIEDIFKDIQ